MLLLPLLIAVIVTSTNCSTISPSYKLRIKGGESSSIEEAPYTVQLVQNSNLFCGAIILNETWLVSAAHCLADKQKEDITVYTGSTDRLKGEKHEVEKIIIYPQFNPDTLNNDISLIKLSKPINFTEQQKSIPLAENPPVVGSILKISGYGRQSETDAHSPVIKVAYVPIVNLDECRQNYRKIQDSITDSMFCAGNGTADSCIGDSGGPAVIDKVLVGVISAGQGCGSNFFSGVYTRVDMFRNWLLNVTSGNETIIENEVKVTTEEADNSNVEGTTDKPTGGVVVDLNENLPVKSYFPNHEQAYAWVQANVNIGPQTIAKPYDYTLDDINSKLNSIPPINIFPTYNLNLPQQQVGYSAPDCYNEQYRLSYPTICQLIYLQQQPGWFGNINSIIPVYNYYPTSYWNNYYPASYDPGLDYGAYQQQQVTPTDTPNRDWINKLNGITLINSYHPTAYWNYYYPAASNNGLNRGAYPTRERFDAQYRLCNPWHC